MTVIGQVVGEREDRYVIYCSLFVILPYDMGRHCLLISMTVVSFVIGHVQLKQLSG